ncbi:MAG: hypothetical protein AAF554_15435 [Bacteroidota bacterium]
MKRIYFLGMVLVLWGHISAQTTKFEGSIINASEVPSAVIASQAENFEGKKVVRWKRQNSKGRKGNSFTRYVSVMKEGKRPLSNARYTPSGELLYYAEYYGSKNIPAFLLPDLEASFPGYRITGGTHIRLYKTQKEYYRIRLKKTSTITYVFYDKNGNQVDRNKLPKDADF